MQVDEAWTAEHLFHLRAAIQVAQHPDQFDLPVGARGEIGVAALGGDRLQTMADAVQVCLPETRSGSDDHGVAAFARMPACSGSSSSAVSTVDPVAIASRSFIRATRGVDSRLATASASTFQPMLVSVCPAPMTGPATPKAAARR